MRLPRRRIRMALLEAAILGAALGGGPATAAFAPQPPVELSGTSPSAIATGDFNHDGVPDLALAMSGVSGGDGKVSVLLGDGAGGFTDHPFPVAFNPYGVSVADFDGDGKDDLAVSSGGAGNQEIVLFLGSGDGGFQLKSTSPGGGDFPFSLASGDYDEDGKADLAVANAGTPGGVSVLRGRGDGTFGQAVTVPGTENLQVLDISDADLNGDGHRDLLIPQALLTGAGNGQFVRQANFGGKRAQATADINRDGYPDVITLDGDTLTLWLAAGDGTFFNHGVLRPGSGLADLVAGDFNGDANPDLAVASEQSASVIILAGAGDGSFVGAGAYTVAPQPAVLIAGDWNGDGAQDIAAACRNLGETAFVSLLLNSSTPGPATVSLGSASLQIREEVGTVQLGVIRDGDLSTTTSVDFAGIGGTAVAGADYASLGGTLVFAPGDSRKSVAVTIIDDAAYEPPEQFLLVLSAPAGATLRAPSETVVQILDNDPPPAAGLLSFSASGYQVAEDGREVILGVSRTSGSQGTASVDVVALDDSALAGSDFLAPVAPAVLGDGVTSAQLTIPILDDAQYEGEEIFRVRLANATGGAVVADPASVTVTIHDNEPPPEEVFRLELDTATVGETDRFVDVGILRGTANLPQSTVLFRTVAVSATAGADYREESRTIEFAQGQPRQSLTVTLFDDSIAEPDETFLIQLTGPGSQIVLASALITISDDDSSSKASAGGGGAAGIVFMLMVLPFVRKRTMTGREF